MANPHSVVARRFAEVAARFASDEPDAVNRGGGLHTIRSIWSEGLAAWRDRASRLSARH